MACAYRLEEFLAACQAGTDHVYASKGAMEAATANFKLVNQKQALTFLGAFRLEEFALQDSSPWRNCPGVTCDAYTFFDGSIAGYLSFGRPKKDGRWVIKSLKFNNRGKR